MWFLYSDILPKLNLGAVLAMTAPQPKAPINWIAVFALLFLPVAIIAIPLYAYHHDFLYSLLDQHVCVEAQ